MVSDSGQVELFYWNNSDINSEDVVFETENEINESLAQKRSFIYDLLNYGLLHDEDGKLSNSMRHKILEQLGFGVWNNSKDIKSLHIDSAEKENLELLQSEKISMPKEIDDHDVHINEHIKFMLSSEYERANVNKQLDEKMLEHIKSHRKFDQLTKMILSDNQGDK